MSTKPAIVSVGDKRWLTKSEVMGYLGIGTEAIFDREWKEMLNIYTNGLRNKEIYDKQQVDRVMERKMLIIKATK